MIVSLRRNYCVKMPAEQGMLKTQYLIFIKTIHEKFGIYKLYENSKVVVDNNLYESMSLKIHMIFRHKNDELSLSKFYIKYMNLKFLIIWRIRTNMKQSSKPNVVNKIKIKQKFKKLYKSGIKYK